MSFDIDKYKKLEVKELGLPGAYLIKLVVNGDNRGWFKESYQQAKLEALGLPHFEVVQNNVSYNLQIGVTRGLHAEPWDKYISMVYGSVIGAWVDLRKGPSFGKVITLELNPGTAVFIPKGIANGYQTLEENSIYTYLVNDHWSPDVKYVSLNLFDPILSIDWPTPKQNAIFSKKDQLSPMFSEIEPMEF
jgi:dTDP-4-dehydrorhamnose 3,5-epimerase